MIDSEMLRAMLLWPAVVTAAFLLPLMSARVKKHPAIANAVVALALFTGVIAAYWSIVGSPLDPFAMDAKARLPLVAFLSLIAAIGMPKLSGLARYALTGVLALASMYLVLGTAIEFQWSAAEAVVRVGAFSIGLVVLLESSERLLATLEKNIGAAALAALAGLAAPFMLFADSLILAQLHVALGIVSGVLCLAVWFGIASSIAPARQLIVTVAGSLWAIALLFGNVETLAFFLLVICLPLASIVARATRNSSNRQRAVTATCALLLPLGIALALGFSRYQESASPSAESDTAYGYAN